VLEVVYTSLLVAIFLLVAWFSVYVVYKLYQGQR
jgi:cell division protein FtsL